MVFSEWAREMQSSPKICFIYTLHTQIPISITYSDEPTHYTIIRFSCVWQRIYVTQTSWTYELTLNCNENEISEYMCMRAIRVISCNMNLEWIKIKPFEPFVMGDGLILSEIDEKSIIKSNSNFIWWSTNDVDLFLENVFISICRQNSLAK